MSEILGDPDPVDRYDLSAEPDREPPPPGPPASRFLLAALVEPATLAVVSVLSLGVAAVYQPAYRFTTYPFNQGVDHLNGIFDAGALAASARPLHDYLVGAWPALLLSVLAVACGGVAVVRSRAGGPAWVRAVGAAGLVVSLVLLATLVVGAYRTSMIDLTLPTSSGG